MATYNKDHINLFCIYVSIFRQPNAIFEEDFKAVNAIHVIIQDSKRL